MLLAAASFKSCRAIICFFLLLAEFFAASPKPRAAHRPLQQQQPASAAPRANSCARSGLRLFFFSFFSSPVCCSSCLLSTGLRSLTYTFNESASQGSLRQALNQGRLTDPSSSNSLPALHLVLTLAHDLACACSSFSSSLDLFAAPLACCQPDCAS
jgi:hypothetical protein